MLPMSPRCGPCRWSALPRWALRRPLSPLSMFPEIRSSSSCLSCRWGWGRCWSCRWGRRCCSTLHIVSLMLCASNLAGYSPVSFGSLAVVSGGPGRVKSAAVVGSTWSPGLPREVDSASAQLRGGGAQALPLGHVWAPPSQHAMSGVMHLSPQEVRPSGHTGAPSLWRRGRQMPSVLPTAQDTTSLAQATPRREITVIRVLGIMVLVFVDVGKFFWEKSRSGKPCSLEVFLAILK
ncbi:hypothetical protein B0T11DRAFT_135987 [Plectosphaerella cucumerina]|uniref:Uncharacterized protein n=1 Tax=Plectosphaerella cucumerina TaxID=40658 RepID=A0A8K0T6S6_9PEZI|nr:hypothetical protein B0T11DRAFT_135987 [Plectosphaerella cucumerina]